MSINLEAIKVVLSGNSVDVVKLKELIKFQFNELGEAIAPADFIGGLFDLFEIDNEFTADANIDMGFSAMGFVVSADHLKNKTKEENVNWFLSQEAKPDFSLWYDTTPIFNYKLTEEDKYVEDTVDIDDEDNEMNSNLH